MCATEPTRKSGPEGVREVPLTTQTASEISAKGKPSSCGEAGTGESPSPIGQTTCEQTVQVGGPPTIAPPSVQLYGEARVRVRHFKARIEEVKG